MKKKNKKVIETRKNEVRFVTVDPDQMKGRYLAKNLTRDWNEDFVDEDSGEVVSITRSEIIAPVGLLIDNDILSQINFFLTSKDITEVEVSNQKREGIYVSSNHLAPWSITAQIGKKKHRFLLYAESINMAFEIAKDFIELNFSGSFQILQAKGFNNCIMIKDSLKKQSEVETDDDENSLIDKKFYQIDVRVFSNDTDWIYTFIIQTKDVDTGMIIINNWIKNSLEERQSERGVSEEIEFSTTIESAVVIPCSCTIEKEFSVAYSKTETE